MYESTPRPSSRGMCTPLKGYKPYTAYESTANLHRAPPRPALPLFQGKKVIKAPTFLLAALSSLFIFHNQINKRWIDLV